MDKIEKKEVGTQSLFPPNPVAFWLGLLIFLVGLVIIAVVPVPFKWLGAVIAILGILVVLF
ncbi:MAG: hypothetical protein H0Z39_06830 [Peptococcaceae bacterium]|nr:hypothetical protein [Peptococcaceae bacterium]